MGVKKRENTDSLEEIKEAEIREDELLVVFRAKGELNSELLFSMGKSNST